MVQLVVGYYEPKTGKFVNIIPIVYKSGNKILSPKTLLLTYDSGTEITFKIEYSEVIGLGRYKQSFYTIKEII